MKTDTTLHASESNVQTAPVSKGSLWAGRVMSALAALFLFMDGGMKLFKPPVVVQATVQLGYPESTIVGIGIALLASTLLYVIPRTSLFGAILLTGYLGGAVASNVRVATPLFNILFPVVFAALVWGGLWLRDRHPWRDPRLRWYDPRAFMPCKLRRMYSLTSRPCAGLLPNWTPRQSITCCM